MANAKVYEIEETILKVEVPPDHSTPTGGDLVIKLSTPPFPEPQNLPKLPTQRQLDCNPIPASQLYVDLATANTTYVTSIQSAMAALGSATTALATAQATHYEALQTYDYDIAVGKQTRIEAYYNAGLTFLQAIFPSS